VTAKKHLRIAVVSEGPSDYLVLRSVIAKILPGAEVVPVHPEVPIAAYPEYRRASGTASRGTGWLGVKAWCVEYSGYYLELFLSAVVGEEFDGLIVHLDASMAGNVDIDMACPPASATTDPLRKVVIEGWFGFSSQPSFLVLVTPSKSTDAWVLAALEPGHPDLECDIAIENALVKLGKLRKSHGRVRKPRDRYEALARVVGVQLSQVRGLCSEAERFTTDLLHFASHAEQEQRKEGRAGE
jgi:hypothetical protein